MLMRIEASHYFDVPVERGFAFITDTAHWSKFRRSKGASHAQHSTTLTSHNIVDKRT